MSNKRSMLLGALLLLVALAAGPTVASVLAQDGDGPLSGETLLVLVGTITADTAVHEGPSQESAQLGVLAKGRLVTLVDLQEDWFEIVYAGSRTGHGWVPTANVEILEPEPTRTPRPTMTSPVMPGEDESASAGPPAAAGTVLAARLNVRSAPGLQGDILGQLNQGDQVDVQDRQGGWLQIPYPAAPTGTAWVSRDFVAVAGEPTPQPVASSPASPPASQLTGTLAFQASSGGPIYLMQADGSGLRRLTTGIEPTLSPDLSQIAFTRWDVPRGLYVMDVDEGAERLLIGENLIKSPTWSPDGGRLAFNQQRGGSEARTITFPGFGEFTIPADPHWRLGVVGADGNGRDNLPDQLHSFNPAWHSQGILYADKHGLFLTADDGESRQIYRTNQAVRNPSFSPDGQFIVATMELHDHWEIVRLNADGSGLVRLTPTRAGQNSVAPAWSPDGRHVVFLTDREGPWKLWVMDAEGANARPLAPQTLAGVDFKYDFNAERVVDWR